MSSHLFACLIGYPSAGRKAGVTFCPVSGPSLHSARVLNRVSPVLGSGLPVGTRSLDQNPHPGLFCPLQNMAAWLLRMPPPGVVRESKSHHKVQTQSCRLTPGRQGPRAPELVLAQNHQQLDSSRAPSLGSSISPALSPPRRCRITPPSLAAFAPCPHPHASPAGIEWQLGSESRCPGSEASLAGNTLGSVRPRGAPRLPAPAAPTVPPARGGGVGRRQGEWEGQACQACTRCLGKLPGCSKENHC